MREDINKPSLKNVILDVVNGHIDTVYAKVAREKDIPVSEIHRSGVCEVVSESLYRDLRSLYGENVELMRFEQAGFALHEFVRLRFGIERWIVDPTWQQFLEKPDAHVPRVLIIKENDAQTEFSKYGISEVKQLIWKQAQPSEMAL